jgi:death-on-curing family protein
MSENDKKKFIDALVPTLITLENFDKGTIINKTKQPEIKKITLEDAIELIGNTRESLNENNQEVRYFGIDNSNGLAKVIDTIYSTYDNEDLYPFFEDKAANLLYLIIKNHPFVDGNKRIATMLFDYYTETNGHKVTIIPSFPLHIAESKPLNKDLMVDLIISQIQEKK